MLNNSIELCLLDGWAVLWVGVIYELVSEIRVKCGKCGRVFIRYIYKRHSVKHAFRHHRGHKGGGLNPMTSCYYCNGEVRQVN